MSMVHPPRWCLEMRRYGPEEQQMVNLTVLSAEGGTRTLLEALFGWLRHSLDGPVARKSVLFLSIFVESYQFMWNGFALSFALMV
jgi:hypothetical protein